jgi:MoaA/NifB/PqqE/SkfB family radical SAM enzyme
MTWENYQKIVNELAELEVFFVNLSGGEAFTHPQIARFIRFAHSKFRHVVVLTNGTILRAEHIETVKDIVQTKGSFPVQVSIDSISSTINQMTRSGAAKILRNVKILSDIGADIVIAMVLSRFNAESVLESIVELSQYTRHFHVMEVQQVRALNGADEEYKLPEHQLAQLWDKIAAAKERYGLQIEIPDDREREVLGCAYGAPCMAGFSHVVIDPSLKVRPCDRCVETFVGDLNVQTMAQVWHGQTIKQVLDSPLPFCQHADQRISVDAGLDLSVRY